MKTLFVLVLSTMVLAACGSKPKVITAESTGSAVQTAHAMMDESPHGNSS